MILFLWHVQNRQIHGDREWARDCPGLGGRGGWEVTSKEWLGFFLGGRKASGRRYGWWLHSLRNMAKMNWTLGKSEFDDKWIPSQLKLKRTSIGVIGEVYIWVACYFFSFKFLICGRGIVAPSECLLPRRKYLEMYFSVRYCLLHTRQGVTDPWELGQGIRDMAAQHSLRSGLSMERASLQNFSWSHWHQRQTVRLCSRNSFCAWVSSVAWASWPCLLPQLHC